MAKRVLPIRLPVETIEKADSLIPFVREREKEKATRSDVIRLCLNFGLDAMEEAAKPTQKTQGPFKA